MSSSDSLFNGIDIMLLATLLQIVKLLVCDKTKDIAAVDVAGVAARVFEWGGQKFDNILNLSHYAWMTDKIVRPKELLIPPKTVLYNSNYEQKFYKYILTKNSKIQMRKFHLSKKWGDQGPPAPPSPRPLCRDEF